MKKKLCFIAFTFLLGSVIFAQTETDFNVGLTEDGTGAVITGYIGKTLAVRIPATIEGFPVREIGSGAFEENTDITSVVIPQGVIKIGSNAFAYTYELASVTLPEGLLEIGAGAFRGSALTAITLPQSLTILAGGAFSVTPITSATLPGSLIYIGDRLFQYCKELRTVNLSEGITKIPIGMFDGCIALNNVTLPNSITTIGGSAFRKCTALTAISLPVSIMEIESTAFSECSALTTVTIPATVAKINFTFGYQHFEGCPRLNLASQAALRRVGYTGHYLRKSISSRRLGGTSYHFFIAYLINSCTL